MELNACPVRLFTPAVEAWLSLFTLTHELRPGTGWVRTSLPAAGGVGNQPSTTLEALNWIRRVWNGVLQETAGLRRPPAPGRRGR